jgi:hypothetical protein
MLSQHLEFISFYSRIIRIYLAEEHEPPVSSKLQRGLSVVEWHREHGQKVKINKEMTQTICFSAIHRVPEEELELKGRNMFFVFNIRYLHLIFERNMTRKIHIERTVAKAMATYTRLYSLLRIERLSSNINDRLHSSN